MNTQKSEPKKSKEANVVQTMLVFDDHPIIDELKALDLDSLTPLQAINLLAELKEKANK